MCELFFDFFCMYVLGLVFALSMSLMYFFILYTRLYSIGSSIFHMAPFKYDKLARDVGLFICQPGHLPDRITLQIHLG